MAAAWEDPGMICETLDDGLVVVRLAFGLFVLRLPATAWGALVEFTVWICPLTSGS